MTDMESSTEILLRMLDERGVEWNAPSGLNARYADSMTFIGNSVVVSEIDGSDLLRINFDGTPEQAIAATVGCGECTPHGKWESISQTQEVRHVFCECGYELGMDERDSSPFSPRLFAMPNYCQECGRRIRKRVVER